MKYFTHWLTCNNQWSGTSDVSDTRIVPLPFSISQAPKDHRPHEHNPSCSGTEIVQKHGLRHMSHLTSVIVTPLSSAKHLKQT